jgi:hypothetical protein
MPFSPEDMAAVHHRRLDAMTPFTTAVVLDLAAAQRWSALFAGLVAHLAAHPRLVARLTPTECEQLLHVLVVFGPTHGTRH